MCVADDAREHLEKKGDEEGSAPTHHATQGRVKTSGARCLGHQKKKMPPPLPLNIGPLAALAKVPASSQRSCKLMSSKRPGKTSDWLLTGLCLLHCSCCACCCLAACWHRVSGLRDACAYARRTGLHACGHHCTLPAHTVTLCWV